MIDRSKSWFTILQIRGFSAILVWPRLGHVTHFFGLGLVTRIYCVPKMFFSRGPCYNGVHFWTWPKTLNPNNILVQTDPPRIQFLNIKLLLIEIELEYSIIYATFTSIYIFNRLKFEKKSLRRGIFFDISGHYRLVWHINPS